jgi:centromere/kinetochore protein ZW10
MFTLYLDQLAKASNISENATHFVSNLFRQASMDIIGFLDGDHSASRVWDRFTAIGIFMEMSLSDIQVALSEGVFLSVTGQELTRLVKATFDDSPKRRHLLALLSS